MPSLDDFQNYNQGTNMMRIILHRLKKEGLSFRLVELDWCFRVFDPEEHPTDFSTFDLAFDHLFNESITRIKNKTD